MPAPKRPPAKAPGENIPEALRRTEAVKLRIPREDYERFAAIAHREEMTIQQWLLRLARREVSVI